MFHPMADEIHGWSFTKDIKMAPQLVVERRSCVGVRLELFTEDRQATRGDLAANTVYVTDAIGYLLGLLTGFFIDSSGGDGVTHVVFCNVLQSWKLYTVPLVRP
ncbi:hypothetical protein P8452_61778 [Trifolium repens]|nr:hypothetical protein P8452_61778 [Trifolium repens]